MSSTLPIHERFHSFQGEGVHSGRPAFFVRTFGCPVHCPWCDSAGTWHPDHVPDHIDKMTVGEIRQEAMDATIDFVVITGGEPTVLDLAPLTKELRTSLLQVHLETSGAFPLRGEFDWITLSPKRWRMPLKENVQQAEEFKIIVEKPDDIPYYVYFLEECFGPAEIPVPIWLHPEWSQRKNSDVLNAISKTVVEKWRGHPFRAGWQLHKLYAVDLADKRSRPPVPLGGDSKRGF